MAHVFNSTIERRTPLKRGSKSLKRSAMKPSQTPMKRSGKLRPIRKTEPGSDARLKQDLTKALSIYVRMRDPLCIVCEERDSEHGGHLFHRDMPSVEFDPRNVWGCCARCNFNHETNGQPMHDAVLTRLGERAYDDLCTLAHNHKMKLGTIELQLLLSELKERIREQRR